MWLRRTGNVQALMALTQVRYTALAHSQWRAKQALTLNQVLGWIWANGVDKDATEAAVAQQIQNQINPPIVTPPLPWT